MRGLYELQRKITLFVARRDLELASGAQRRRFTTKPVSIGRIVPDKTETTRRINTSKCFYPGTSSDAGFVVQYYNKYSGVLYYNMHA